MKDSEKYPNLTPEELEKRRAWLPDHYELILCPECGSGCCYCGLMPDDDEVSHDRI
jgi:hypothetical protein